MDTAVTVSDAEQLIELRKLAKAMLGFLDNDEPTLLQADNLAKELRAALNPDLPKETQ